MELRSIKYGDKLLLLLVLALGAAMTPANGDLQEYLWPTEIPAPVENSLTLVRSELGKALFFDARLSGNNQMSCATCHQEAKAWSDSLPKAKGVNGRLAKRSTPVLFNVAYQRHLGWDGRFRSLEQQALSPVTEADEMNQDLDELIAELEQVPKYQVMFNKAYPEENINKETIAKALASFQRTLVSGKAPFDRAVRVRLEFKESI